MARKRKKLGDLLLAWGLLDKAQLEKAVAHAQNTNRRLGEALIEMGLVEEEQVTKAMATQFDLEYVDLDHHVIDLTEAICQYALLAAPMKPLCHNDCAGLCQKCGHNLNKGPCACPTQEIDSRWSELTNLL